jgi:hypothetical protein
MSEPAVTYVVSPDAPPADADELIEAVVRLLLSIDHPERVDTPPGTEQNR